MTITSVLLSLALAAGPPAAPLWDHPGYDAEDSHYNPDESAINAGSIGRLSTKWSINLRTSDTSCSGPSAPVLSGGRLFATDQLGISGYTAADGRLEWRFDWDDVMDNDIPVLAVSDGLLIAANGDCNSQSDPNGQLTALDVATGKPRWSLPMDMPINAVVVDKGTVVVSGSSPSDEDAVVAYRVRDGRLLWRKPNHATTGVCADGILLVHRTDGFGVHAGEIAGVDIGTGTNRWTSSGGWKARAASPRADRFYVTNAIGSLAALDTATGALRWTANGKASELIAADGRRVYRADGRAVEALHAGTGKRLWTTRLSTDAVQPVRAGGLLYAGSTVLNAADGTVAGPAYPGHLVVTGGRLYQVSGSVLRAYAP
ncbi:outer membrane protein assembly factor BamB family protein [Actinoplanes aureus]|uniref:PQQ-binding-like beta-propeller repeat protein n=1 Tax=Actinoplanes aureus TaxID=2792083 RepID=A0A931C9K6_9ACTN|nr:PQQ-binding-like beta-propeller repeat protein [Actinoplanes aureus]MBG0560860.1 PQQ-binding-like beta-propeller repeat protein [Actinoplanes aureus]